MLPQNSEVTMQFSGLHLLNTLTVPMYVVSDGDKDWEKKDLDKRSGAREAR